MLKDLMYDLLDIIIPIVLTILAIVLFLGGIFLALNFYNTKTCKQISEQTGRYTQYRVLSGCYIQVNDELIPVDNWREIR